MRSRSFVVTVMVVALLLPSASLGDSFVVKARGGSNGKWDPDVRRIAVGDKIVWKNPTEKRHNVVAYKGPWDKNTMLDPGEQTSKRFKKAATYKYLCKLHGFKPPGEPCTGMCGKIVVKNN